MFPFVDRDLYCVGEDAVPLISEKKFAILTEDTQVVIGLISPASRVLLLMKSQGKPIQQKMSV
jgi:hypothetical protein